MKIIMSVLGIIVMINVILVVIFGVLYFFQRRSFDLNLYGLEGKLIVDFWYWRLIHVSDGERTVTRFNKSKVDFQIKDCKFKIDFDNRKKPIMVLIS